MSKKDRKEFLFHITYKDGTERIKEIAFEFTKENFPDHKFKCVDDMIKQVENSLLSNNSVRAFTIWTTRVIKTHKSFAEDFDPANWVFDKDFIGAIENAEPNENLDGDMEQVEVDEYLEGIAAKLNPDVEIITDFDD